MQMYISAGMNEPDIVLISRPQQSKDGSQSVLKKLQSAEELSCYGHHFSTYFASHQDDKGLCAVHWIMYSTVLYSHSEWNAINEQLSIRFHNQDLYTPGANDESCLSF